MPTLPLYTPNDVADASHRVIAPGGYEWWHFDAESSTGALRVAATLGGGFGSDPEYFSRYLKYRRQPTRHPPPLPADFPRVRFALFEAGHVLARFESPKSPQEYGASAVQPQVRVGSTELTEEADGLLRLRVNGGRAGSAYPLTAELEFRPLVRHRPHEVTLVGPPPTWSRHDWVVARPVCEVSGTFWLTVGLSPRDVEFRGRGYHDHGFGTEPPALHIHRSIRGVALFDGRTLAFRVDEPADATRKPVAWVVEADATGVRDLPVRRGVRGAPDRRGNGSDLPRELRLELATGDVLRLAGPKVLGESGVTEYVAYGGVLGTTTFETVCEVQYHRRRRGY